MRFPSRRLFAVLLALLTLPGLSPFDAVPAARSSELDAAPSADVPDVASPIEARAVALAVELGMVPLGHDQGPCPVDRLYAAWNEPIGTYQVGAYLAPVGPRPTAGATEANGIVFCRDSTYAYMGFEASRAGSGWTVSAVPVIPHEEHEEENEPDDAPPAPDAPQPAPATPAANLPAGIEGYAAFEGQSTCDPSAKPGLLAFRDLILRKYPWTRSSGISRGCSVGGRSEHKEGRAWDWAVDVNRPDDRAAADEVTAWMLATDDAGNAHAMARRTGLMYMIWNRQMWASYRAGSGWRSYQGPSAHTDHVHFSFSWAGARAQTSFFSGMVAELPTVVLSGAGVRDSDDVAPRRHRASAPAPRPGDAADDPDRGERRRRSVAPATTTPPPPQPEPEPRPRRSRRRPSTTTTTTVAPSTSPSTAPSTSVADGSCRRRCGGKDRRSP